MRAADFLRKIKKADPVSAALACWIALCTTAATRVNITGGSGGKNGENYVSAFGWKAVLLFLCVFTLGILLLPRVSMALRAGLCRVSAADGGDRTVYWRRWGRRWAVINILAWLPYYLSYYPGGIYVDTFASVIYYYEGRLSNRHPFLLFR